MKYETTTIICATYDKKAECWDIPFNMRTEKEIEHRIKKLEEIEPGRYEIREIGWFKNGKIETER